MKRLFNNFPPLFLLTFISVFIALSACHDDEELIIADESKKKITVKRLNQKEIKEITPIYEQVVSMNSNIYGRNQDEVYEVSLSNALYITDGTIESFTFPIETIDSLTRYNLMLNVENGEYQPYLVHYDLTDLEYAAYLEGNSLDLSEKTTVSILQNNEISITDKNNPETNGCFQLFTVYEECYDHYGVNNHCYMNDCDGRKSYLEIHEIPCVTGGGGNGGYTPGTPPGPGSPGGGGTYGGPSGSDGSPGGYTGFVIGDGGTGNQDDVDAINQVTQEMDAAFGVGNWDTEMIGLIIETINNNAEVDTAVEAVDKIITEGIQNVPKLMATYNELGGSPQVQQFLNLFDDNWDLTDLYFEHDNNFANTFNLEDGEATYAITLPFGNEFNLNPNGISIVFNTQNNHPGNILNKSTPFRSSVFFHEIIHAQIILYLASLFNDANVNSENYSPEAWKSFIQAIRNDKLGVFELYTQAYLANPNTSSEQEHEIMANHYFPIMYYVLSQLYPNLTDEEINALIWIGLTGTRAYQQHAENFPGGEMMFHMYLTNTLSIIELNFLIDE